MARSKGTEYKNETVRIAELPDPRQGALTGYVFEDCELFGPAVLYLGRGNELRDSRFEGDTIGMWFEVDANATKVIGVIGLQDCRIVRCTLHNIGIAAKRADLAEIKAQVTPHN